MSYPINHKTIFVLDHRPNFLISSQQDISINTFKSKKPGFIPPAPLPKSLWTCSVEAVLEYCRIVWDIFHREKFIRFIVTDDSTVQLNTWSQDQHTLCHLMESLAQAGPPQSTSNSDCSIRSGLNAALQGLCECSKLQQKNRTMNNTLEVLNRGRIICLTNLKSDSETDAIIKQFADDLRTQNMSASCSDSMLPINHCELVILHIYPVGKESCITSQAKNLVSPFLSTEIHSVQSGCLAAKLQILVQQHYNLASTTVTGIPMKEEQNANSSTTYDVELLHSAAAHEEYFKMGAWNSESVFMQNENEGQVYQTISLKWCTPKSSSVELHHCTRSCPVTPVDVNSRPTACLINFLLTGRTVMLESVRKSSTKVLSHMLASHGGEIHIHTLGKRKSILQDPPSIREGYGGQITDYRIEAFGEFINENKLMCFQNQIDSSEAPIEKAKKKLARLTLCWPIVISHTIIFNLNPDLLPALKLIKKETLDQNEVKICKKFIFDLITLENKGMPLPVSTIAAQVKNHKREMQYHLLWKELEAFIRRYCSTVEHQSILDCLLECNKEQSLKLFKSTTEDIRLIAQISIENKISKSNLDSQLCHRPKKVRLNTDSSADKERKSLMSLWMERINADHKRHCIEFAGQISEQNPANLYTNVKANEKLST